jgi:hypothetical protein
VLLPLLGTPKVDRNSHQQYSYELRLDHCHDAAAGQRGRMDVLSSRFGGPNLTSNSTRVVMMLQTPEDILRSDARWSGDVCGHDSYRPQYWTGRATGQPIHA